MAKERHTTIFFDEEVRAHLVSVLNEAQKFSCIVTPYVQIAGWTHLKNAIKRAVNRNVDVILILRDDDGAVEAEDLRWLQSSNVKLYVVERLHAKIYLSERRTVLSSMNLTESSRNSLEFAVVLEDPDQVAQVRSYVRDSLMKVARRLDQPAPHLETRTPVPAQIEPGSAGHCIRCTRTIPLDPARPLCGDCYKSWAEWCNEFYPEWVCHLCGMFATVSYAKPLCPSCYQRTR